MKAAESQYKMNTMKPSFFWWWLVSFTRPDPPTLPNGKIPILTMECVSVVLHLFKKDASFTKIKDV